MQPNGTKQALVIFTIAMAFMSAVFCCAVFKSNHDFNEYLIRQEKARQVYYEQMLEVAETHGAFIIPQEAKK